MHVEAKYGQGATARNVAADNSGLIPGRWQITIGAIGR